MDEERAEKTDFHQESTQRVGGLTLTGNHGSVASALDFQSLILSSIPALSLSITPESSIKMSPE